MKYVLIIFSIYYSNSVPPVTATFVDYEHCSKAARFINDDLSFLDEQKKFFALCFKRGE